MDEIAQAVVAGLNKAVLKEAAEEKKR